jgi:tetratricopeptide (TPR) repeat protein
MICPVLKNFQRLPCQVAFVAFVVFALTASRGVTMSSLPLAAKVAGWDWLPMASRPLTWLLTLPLHLLPGNWIPFALNIFSAVVAALTLGVLARSVELLPWNSPPDAKKIWARKLPVLLACAVCGLEFNFWSDATAATGEMVDLLLLTIPVWCLLEYRAANDPRWVNAAAFAWGLGMAENWVMLVTLPLFVASLIWLRKLRFFKLNFLLRMLLLGLAGFSLYALLPLVNWLAPHSPWGFFESWGAAWLSTKGIWHTLYYGFWQWHRLLAISVLLYFLVPTLPCLVRLKNESATNQSKVDRFQTWIYRALRVVLLLACLWLTFDPEAGPRAVIRQQVGAAMPLLTFDYLNALGIAFLAGNLLFASQVPPQRRSRSPLQKFNSLLRRNTTGLLVVVTALMTTGLLVRSLPAILYVNRAPLSGFGQITARSLPSGGGILLGDEAAKLAVVQSVLRTGRAAPRWVTVDVRQLPQVKYRAQLERAFPAGWLTTAETRDLKPEEMILLLNRLANTNRIFYLQPGAGKIIFERFYPEPLAAVSELKTYSENDFLIPPLTPAQLVEGEKFWDAAWDRELSPVSQPRAQRTRALAKIFSRLTIARATPPSGRLLGWWYSAWLNAWGVTLQNNGKLPEAHRRFEQALQLNTNNYSAILNLEVCTNLMAGVKLGLGGVEQVAAKFRNTAQLAQVVGACGPVDEPAVLCLLGRACQQAGWARQALQNYERAHVLAPAALMPALEMIEIFSQRRMDAKVLEIIGQIQRPITNSPDYRAVNLELSLREARSWMRLTNTAKANGILQSIRQQNPNDATVLEIVFKEYLAFGEITNALQLLESELVRDPNNIAALNNKAALLIQSRRGTEALSVLDRALSLTNLPAIRLNRAIARLSAGDYQAAEADYLALQNTSVEKFSIEFGLAEIAAQRHDTNAAIQHLELCIASVPSGSQKWNEASRRLEALKNPAAKK